MPHVNNINFPEYMFAFYFLHTIENNFLKAEIAEHERTEYTP